MPFLANYRRVLSTPGALLFSATGLVGRLPISMAGLGIVLLVQAGTGSYGVAGAVSATYLVANAACAILQGQYLDRWGQGRVLTVLAVAFGAGMTLLAVAVQADWPQAVTYVAAALAGATLPNIGSCVRARWTHVLGGGPGLPTAFALEAVVDEMVFIVGPIVVAVLATLVDPVLGIAAAAAAGTLGSLAFAAQRRTEPPAHPHDRTQGVRPRLPWRTVLPVAVVCAALGVLFGAAEVTTVAFADEHGHKGYSGGLLALWALGSLLSGLITGAITWKRPTSFRVRVGAIGMACAMAPLALIGSIPLMGVFLFLGGFAIAPTMVATITLVQESVPPSRLNEGMAIVQTGIVAGVAPGAALSGVVVDARGASAAYLVSLAAGTLAALAAQALPRERRGGRSLGSPREHLDQLVATGDSPTDT
ncbi:MAG TPA: MFS transporter [Nocardioides sp.]|nr:MFS transporter [Nocardioides sp.]